MTIDPIILQLAPLLTQIGLNVASSAVYDVIKNYVVTSTNPTKEGLKNELITALHIKGADLYTDKIIDFVAKEGLIKIEDSKIFATTVIMESKRGGSFVFKDNSESRTKSGSLIKVPQDGVIEGKGPAKIKQDDKGNISIKAG